MNSWIPEVHTHSSSAPPLSISSGISPSCRSPSDGADEEAEYLYLDVEMAWPSGGQLGGVGVVTGTTRSPSTSHRIIAISCARLGLDQSTPFPRQYDKYKSIRSRTSSRC
ncbi:hypothetical protein [Nonomuraea sp. NPDC049695]|uniref:hypothetical protein n=1 Tax=Nonomuraea sp. NPDC049695 TaxID=3154734 RepID=UPI003443FC79